MPRIQPVARTQREFALVIHALRKSFVAGVEGCHARAHVLNDVEMTVRAGEIVGVSGAVGSGKTTLLLCIAGLLKPDAGTVSVCGVPPDGLASYVAPVAWHTSRLSPSQHLARALASTTPVLLLDGVIADLSSGARMLLVELARRGMTIVVAEREPSRLEPLVGRVITIRNGSIHSSPPTPHRTIGRPARVAEPNAGTEWL